MCNFSCTYRYFSGASKSPEASLDYDDSNLSDYESGSPPSRDESFPSFQHKINTNFFGFKLNGVDNRSLNSKYDFGFDYRQLYADYVKERKLKHRNGETVKWVQNQGYLGESEFCELSNNFNCDKTSKCELNGDLNCDKTLKNSSDNCVGVGKMAPIWCVDYLDNLIVIGCSNGSIEFWEGTTGKFKVGVVFIT